MLVIVIVNASESATPSACAIPPCLLRAHQNLVVGVLKEFLQPWYVVLSCTGYRWAMSLLPHTQCPVTMLCEPAINEQLISSLNRSLGFDVLSEDLRVLLKAYKHTAGDCPTNSDQYSWSWDSCLLCWLSESSVLIAEIRTIFHKSWPYWDIHSILHWFLRYQSKLDQNEVGIEVHGSPILLVAVGCLNPMIFTTWPKNGSLSRSKNPF